MEKAKGVTMTKVKEIPKRTFRSITRMFLRAVESPMTKRFAIVGSLLAYLGYNVPLALWAADIALTENSFDDVYDADLLDAIPAQWSNYIVFVISAWTLASTVYSHTLLCRKKGDQYLVELPAYSTYLYLSYSAGTLLANGTILFGGSDLSYIAPVFTLSNVAGQLAALYFSVVPPFKEANNLINKGLTVDLWLIRGLIQNSIGLDAFWAAHTLLIQLGRTLTYGDGTNLLDTFVSPEATTYIVLSLVGAVLLAWFILDITLFEKYTRYLITPYFTFIIYSAGVLNNFTKKDGSLEAPGIFSLVLLSTAALFAVVKGFVTLAKNCSKSTDPEAVPEEVAKPKAAKVDKP